MKRSKEELLLLGFIENEDGFIIKGINQEFIVRIREERSLHPYYDLYRYISEVDIRPRSVRNGKRYISSIKTCASNGSLEKSISKYDLPDSELEIIYMGFTSIK